ncbi:MAG: hypothetical protein JXA73_08770 [Acidobacteria bacterium]|nr:hypothetical protein [Acidobacteriota bacterium]
MTVDFSRINAADLRKFGGSYALTRINSGTGSLAFTGIPDSGPEEEDVAPGDGSTYLYLWANASDFSPRPARGDEISTATTVYKIVDLQEDPAGGLLLKLRYDRDV